MDAFAKVPDSRSGKKEMESRKEVVNAASMSKAFMANIRFAASSEKFSDAFIDAAYPPLVF